MDNGQPIAIVVDDDVMIRMAAADMLADAGFDLLEAEHGDQAIELLEQAPPRVTLLCTDVQMPGSRDGFALAREVAARWPKIGILVASGAMKPGPDDLPSNATFIAKPFSADIVHEHLRKALPLERRSAPLQP